MLVMSICLHPWIKAGGNRYGVRSLTIRDFLILRNGLMIRKVMYINGEITRLNIIHPAERRTLGSRMGC